ncbi:MAG: putative manganese-dependent inorganic diphosphatase [Terrimicrobiaceae bacterium]
METLVIGHRNPDMDAICSAIGYAEFKKASGDRSVRAARCGNINERIEYALGRFGFHAPDFFSDVRTQVRDVMETGVVCARTDEPIYMAFSRLGERRFRGLPVVDQTGRCAGLLSGLKISRYVFPDVTRAASSREVHTSLASICYTTGAKVLAGKADTELHTMILVVVAMQTDTFRQRLEALDKSRTVLIVGNRHNIQKMAIEAGVRALLLSGSAAIDPALLDLASRSGTVVISSPRDTATTVLLARSSVHVSELLEDDMLTLAPDLTLNHARSQVAMSPQFAFPVTDPDGVMVGILSKSDFLKPVPRQLILVDHNELGQAVSGAAELPIVEILDHHRISAPPTQQPILFLNRPVGSTCSIVADCFERDGIPIPPPVAGLLMCGLIADTLNLTSPTTTPFDRALMERLSKIAGVAPSSLAESIFAVGSPLLTMTPTQAIGADCKDYEENGLKFSVSQIEELTFSHFEEKRSGLIDALEAQRTARGLDFAAMLVTDINTQNSYLLLKGLPKVLASVDFPPAGENTWWLEGIVSRKKQLLPYLCSLTSRVGGREE